MPEAYRQRFRNLRKANCQTYFDFAREKEVLFYCCCLACDADSLSSVRELVLVEELKNCVSEGTIVYLGGRQPAALEPHAAL